LLRFVKYSKMFAVTRPSGDARRSAEYMFCEFAND